MNSGNVVSRPYQQINAGVPDILIGLDLHTSGSTTIGITRSRDASAP